MTDDKSRLDLLSQANERLDLENFAIERVLKTRGLADASDPSLPPSMAVETYVDDGMSLSFLGELFSGELTRLTSSLSSLRSDLDLRSVELNRSIAQLDDRVNQSNREHFELQRDVGDLDSEQLIVYLTKRIEHKVDEFRRLTERVASIKCKLVSKQEAIRTNPRPKGELKFVDFHRAQIENLRLTRTANVKHEEFSILKKSSAKSICELSLLKQKVDEWEKKIASAQKNITTMKEEIVNDRTSTVEIQKECKKLKKEISKIEDRLVGTEGRVPDVIALINAQVDLEILQNKKSNLNRKMQIHKKRM